MASVKLGSKAVGSIVKLKVNGALRNFIVAHQGRPSSLYDTSCDGTWLLMETCYEKKQWNSSNSNDYATSTIHSHLNSTFLNLFDANIRSRIKQAKIPYRPNSGTGQIVNSGANGLSVKIFLLSALEVGFTQSGTSAYIVNDGARLAYFGNNSVASNRIATYDGSASYWWLRSPNIVSANSCSHITPKGAYAGGGASSNTFGVRPALILPPDLMVADDGTVTANTAPSTPSALTVPATIHGGSTITLSWTASTDAESNLEGYAVERSLDGGSTWAQIYQGSARTATNTVAFGTESVMYRVRAYDAEGLYSGWKTSGQVAVINNTAPTPPDGITVPEAVNGGRPLTISWGASADGENNLAGYCLERQADGGEWEAVYTGPELSFTDQVTKGWQTVAYRVRAYDTENAYSGYTAGEARAVNNNTPPEITCEYPANTSLGVKTEGFSVPYSVADEEGDPVSVTEAVDGVTLRTFAAQLGEAYSFELDGADFMKVLNGSHTLSITAQDGASGTTHSLTFTKRVTKAAVTLAQPMEADGPISVCVLSVSGSIPADAAYTVEVSNNAKDEAPAWEDCTEEIRTGANHIFTNDAAANGPAFSFRLSVERGESGQGGYISSVQGGFQ